MMTKEMMMTTIEALGEDATAYTIGDTIHVTLEDFEGFSEDWDEISREYDDPDAVEEFLGMLTMECVRTGGDFYLNYYFDDFTVVVGYASFDI